MHEIWLAGVLETEGTIGIYVGRDRRKGPNFRRVTSIIQVVDRKHPDWIDRFKELYGGSTTPVGNPIRWTLKGRAVVGMAELIYPYCTSRRSTLDTILSLDDLSLAERITRAEALRGLDRFEGLRPDDYERVCTLPEFLAGIVDIRGYLFRHKVPSGRFIYQYPALTINNRNKALLDALQARFDGHIREASEEGDTFWIDGRSVTTIYPSYQLSIHQSGSHSLLTLVLPHLQLKRQAVANILLQPEPILNE